MADTDLGKARGVIEIDVSTLNKTAAALDYVGNRMLAVGLVGVAAFGYALKSAADFNEQLSRFKAVGNATENQIEAIRQKALQLGRDSAYGATEVMQAFAELGYAGASAKDIINGLGDATVYLAAAGELPLKDAAYAVIVTMHQFNLTAKDSVKIANALARGANASTANIQDLVTSLRYAGTAAGPLGYKMKDVVDTLAILANEGLRGSIAGTSLRGVLVGLTPTSDKAAEMMRKLGIITLDGANAFYDASGKAKSLSEVSQILKEHTKGLSDEERKLAFQTIFGRRAMSAAIDMARGGKKAYDDLHDSAQYNTTAQQIMKEKLDNVKGSLKILKASLETAAIVLVDRFSPAIKGAADILRDIVNWFAKLDPKWQNLIAGAIGAFFAFFLLLGVFLKIVGIAAKTVSALSTIASAMDSLAVAAGGADVALGPFFLIVLAIIVALIIIGVVAYVFYKNWDKIWNWIGHHKAYAILIGWFLLIMAPLILIGIVVAIVAKKWKVAWDAIKSATAATVNWIIGAAHWLENAWNNTLAWFQGPFMNFWKVELPAFFASLPGRLVGWLQAAALAFLNTLQNLPFYMAFVLGLVIGLVISFAANLVIWAIQAATWFLENFATILENVIPWVMDFGSRVILQFATWLVQLIEALPGWLQAILDKFIEWGPKVLEWMFNFGVDMVQKTGEWAMKIAPKIFEFLVNLPGDLLMFGIHMLGSFLDGLNIGTGGVDSFFSELPGRIIGALAGLESAMWGLGWSAMKGFLEGLKNVADNVLNFAKSIADKVVGTIKSALSVFSPSKVMMEVGKNTMLGFLIGMQKITPDILGHVGMVGAGVASSTAAVGSYAGGGGGVSIDTVKIEIVGVADPALARQVGNAAAGGFVDALTRRQLITTARVV